MDPRHCTTTPSLAQLNTCKGSGEEGSDPPTNTVTLLNPHMLPE